MQVIESSNSVGLLLSISFSLLLLGTLPVTAAAADDCEKAPFQDVPPSEREWSLLTNYSDHFRALLWDTDDWLYLGDPKRTADGLRARGSEAWDTGHRIYRDSLVVHWTDIQRLECDRGSHAPGAILFGAAVGSVAFAMLHEDSGWWVLSIPAGMVIGTIIGGSRPVWRAVYCAAPESSGDGEPKP